jgi:hypothetical protein
MKIKLDQVLVDFEGKEIQDGKEKASLRKLLINALLTPAVEKTPQGLQQEVIEGKEKFERYELARKIKDAKDEIEYKSEDITTLKNCVGKLYNALIVGLVYDMLEGKVEETVQEPVVEAAEPLTGETSEPVAE